MIRRLIDMSAASELGGYTMRAYGTSEGVKKEWDERGRSNADHTAKVNRAKQVLRTPDKLLNVTKLGMTKDAARRFLDMHGIKYAEAK